MLINESDSDRTSAPASSGTIQTVEFLWVQSILVLAVPYTCQTMSYDNSNAPYSNEVRCSLPMCLPVWSAGACGVAPTHCGESGGEPDGVRLNGRRSPMGNTSTGDSDCQTTGRTFGGLYNDVV
ncbi:hypothetical protein J1614_009904 [Plenodomus biglobosus]|nr:hypothetical protein J1614_009904 [Plenodomus biglobosus]